MKRIRSEGRIGKTFGVYKITAIDHRTRNGSIVYRTQCIICGCRARKLHGFQLRTADELCKHKTKARRADVLVPQNLELFRDTARSTAHYTAQAHGSTYQLSDNGTLVKIRGNHQGFATLDAALAYLSANGTLA